MIKLIGFKEDNSNVQDSFSDGQIYHAIIS